MDAFSLISVEHRTFCEQARWTGALSTVIGEASRMIEVDGPKATQRFLRNHLAEFIASDTASEDLRGILREYLK